MRKAFCFSQHNVSFQGLLNSKILVFWKNTGSKYDWKQKPKPFGRSGKMERHKRQKFNF